MSNNNDTRVVQQLVNADTSLWRQVKAQAALDGKTLTEWVEDLARKHLKINKKS